MYTYVCIHKCIYIYVKTRVDVYAAHDAAHDPAHDTEHGAEGYADEPCTDEPYAEHEPAPPRAAAPSQANAHTSRA